MIKLPNIPQQPDPYMRSQVKYQELIKLGHLKYIVDQINGIAIGGVGSVTGLDTDNTDPANPIVKIAVDGVTITGDGTPGNPLTGLGGSAPIYPVNQIPSGDGTTAGGTTSANFQWDESLFAFTSGNVLGLGATISWICDPASLFFGVDFSSGVNASIVLATQDINFGQSDNYWGAYDNNNNGQIQLNGINSVADYTTFPGLLVDVNRDFSQLTAGQDIQTGFFANGASASGAFAGIVNFGFVADWVTGETYMQANGATGLSQFRISDGGTTTALATLILNSKTFVTVDEALDKITLETAAGTKIEIDGTNDNITLTSVTGKIYMPNLPTSATVSVIGVEAVTGQVAILAP